MLLELKTDADKKIVHERSSKTLLWLLKTISCTKSEWSPLRGKIQISKQFSRGCANFFPQSGLHSDLVQEIVFICNLEIFLSIWHS